VTRHATAPRPALRSWRSRCAVSRRAVAEDLSRRTRDMAAVRRELLVHTFKTARVLLRPVSEAADTKVKEVGFKTATVTTKTPVPVGNVSPGGWPPRLDRSASPFGVRFGVDCGGRGEAG
jgi:hypothetical protein